jgi:DNA processing protein
MNQPIPQPTTEVLNGITSYREIRSKSREYPERLGHLAQPPNPLFVLGSLPDPMRLHLAVVGTRRATPYGRRVTRDLVTPLARAGVVIVSGLAYGIDAEAHTAAVNAGGTTLAVLGCGIDHVYPTAHANLAQRVLASGGAVVSEYAPGTPPLQHHFPARNRIIAALAHAVLVIEAPVSSGALITAYGAAELGREVLAVPGSITSPESAGCNGLISRGARLVSGVQDILETLGLDTESVSRQNHETVLAACSEPARKIHAALGLGNPTLDELAGCVDLPTERILAAVTELEVVGLVENLGDGRYAAAPPGP